MKTRRLMLPLLILLVISLAGLPVLAADWPQFARDMSNNSLTDARTPVSEVGSKLTFRFLGRDTDSFNSLSNSLIIGEHVFVGSGDQIHKLDRQGQLVATADLTWPMADYSPFITAGEGKIFAYGFESETGSGYLQAIELAAMTVSWVSDPLPGALESFSPLAYADGWVYAPLSGYDYGSFQIQPGLIAAWQVSEGNSAVTWIAGSPEDQQAYFWNGVAVSENFVYTGSLGGLIQVLDRSDGSQVDQLDLGQGVKSSLTLVQDQLFFGTDNGVGRLSLKADGSLDADSLRLLDLGDQVTTTPVVSGDWLFAGSGDFMGGRGFAVINRQTLTLAYLAEISGTDFFGEEIPVAGIQSTPVVSTAYDNDLYVYFLANARPGSLVRLRHQPDSSSADLEVLFVPEEADQNSSSGSLSVDQEGTLYFSNDSGLLFAVTRQDQEPVPQTGRTDRLTGYAGRLAVVLILGAVWLLFSRRRNRPAAQF